MQMKRIPAMILARTYSASDVQDIACLRRAFSTVVLRCVNGEAAYWRDVGTIDAYWEANMELTKVIPDLNMYDQEWPIWTYQEQLPPAKFVFDDDERRGMAVDSLVSGGCIISGATVRRFAAVFQCACTQLLQR